jgi:hypothetical protein
MLKIKIFPLGIALLSLLVPFARAASESPSGLKIPPMVPEKSISTYVPSDTAPGNGLAVNVIYPGKPRYTEGAPVVVVAPQGEGNSGLEFSTHAAQSGFAEVRFAFPGGGKTGFSSGGVYDHRGVQSQAALRDVLLFAAGKKKDTQGRTISKLVPTKIYNPTVGLIGWSNGGNIALITLAKHAQQLPFVGWLTFYETPLGSMFYPPSLGGAHDYIQNRHYRQGSAATGHCLVDYRKLAYHAEGQKLPGYHRKLGQPEIPGVLFFDENKNGEWDETLEFALPYSSEVGLDKQIYPPHVTLALQKVFGKKWPKTVATLKESEHYFQERDGSLYLTEVAKAMPGLMVTIVGTRLDHLQRQPDHPHIPLNYNGWLANKQKFVRLNPDVTYVGQIANMNPRNFVENKPNASIDSSSIEEFLEPEGLVPDYVYVEAANSEMSDRKKAKNFSETLTAPIVIYTNGAS